MKKELRFSVKDTELRTSEDGSHTVTGFAAVYNSLSLPLGDFKETIDPNAFTDCLATNPDLFLLSEHDLGKGILARTSSGTLSVENTDIGLRFTATLPNTTLGNDTFVSLQRGDLRSMSFAFSCNLDSWSQDGEGMYIRTILNAELYELSIVAQPAYPASTAALRSQFGTPTVPTIKAPIEDNKEVELPYDNTDDLLLALILSLRS